MHHYVRLWYNKDSPVFDPVITVPIGSSFYIRWPHHETSDTAGDVFDFSTINVDGFLRIKMEGLYAFSGSAHYVDTTAFHAYFTWEISGVSLLNSKLGLFYAPNSDFIYTIHDYGMQHIDSTVSLPNTFGSRIWNDSSSLDHNLSIASAVIHYWSTN